MPALKTLGLVVLSVFVVALGSAGFLTLRSLLAERMATDALDRVADICLQVAGSGGSRQTEVEIPSGYTMTFAENRILVDGRHRELPLPFAENLRPIPAGNHTVKVSIEQGKLVVSWT